MGVAIEAAKTFLLVATDVTQKQMNPAKGPD